MYRRDDSAFDFLLKVVTLRWPQRWLRGAMILSCISVAGFAQGTLTNGANHDGAISVPFQVQTWTFSASAGDALFLSIGEVTDDNGFFPYIRLRAPGATEIAASWGGVVPRSMSKHHLLEHTRFWSAVIQDRARETWTRPAHTG